MKTKLTDNEVKEIALMQKKIDSYEGFICATYMMAFCKNKEVNYPVFDGTDLKSEMRFIWRFIKNNLKTTEKPQNGNDGEGKIKEHDS